MTGSSYAEAIRRYPLTDAAKENAAKALALACGGGDWGRDYTEGQRNLWRRRVDAAMEVAE